MKSALPARVKKQKNKFRASVFLTSYGVRFHVDIPVYLLYFLNLFFRLVVLLRIYDPELRENS
jgi:hypothetical protein